MVKKNFGFFIEERFEKFVTINNTFSDGDIKVFKIDIALNSPENLRDFKICYYKPMRGMLSVWHSNALRNRSARQWFDKNGVNSNFYLGAPLITAVDGENNYCTLALSDADTPVRLNFFVDDFSDNDEVCFETILFYNVDKKVQNYSFSIRIDEQVKPYYQAISSVNDWWKNYYNRAIDNCEWAEDALYSSWYNFHQHPNSQMLEKELAVASKMGFKTVILDDGWQYDGNGTADYFDCGDWAFSKEKFPNPKQFVDYVHGLGMKILVWFPVPFVGYNTDKYTLFKDKLLCDNDFFRAGILDPRYKEVREFLVQTYKDFVLKYDLDGLKLDFIDSFKLLPTSSKFDATKMDVSNVEDAVKILLDDVIKMLKQTRDKPLFEFRQFYVGPSITRYCNMLRVADCAFDSVNNRIAVADLRLMNYDLAVHSDMLYWSKHESVTNIKRQLLNVLFSVPQISVLLTQSSQEQLEVIKNHLDYYYANRELLLHGEIQPLTNDQLYPCISAVLGDKTVTVLNNSIVCEYNGKEHDVFNNSDKDSLVIISKQNAKACVVDLFGKCVKTFDICIGANLVDVSIGGLISIKEN